MKNSALSFNRTIVELKCAPMEAATMQSSAFNRTIVELK